MKLFDQAAARFARGIYTASFLLLVVGVLAVLHGCSSSAPPSLYSKPYVDSGEVGHYAAPSAPVGTTNGAEEKRIPYDDILRYPSDWPNISRLRTDASAAGRGWNAPDVAVTGPFRPIQGAGQQAGGQPLIDVNQFVPPQSLPARGDELWVIEKPDAGKTATVDPHDEAPGGGSLVMKDAKGEIVPIPLKHTDVKASVAGYIASVDVTQQFTNPFSEKIEAVYVFPLPHNAAVSEFVMTLGERHIRGIIRERHEAEKIYATAKGQGYVASLLTQERPNIFTQSVANIEPGKQIDIDVRYFSTLAYVDGSFEFVFPMVVGPRFNPPGSTEGIGAVGPGSRGASGQKTEITYLRPEQRSGHDIALDVKIDAGMPIESIKSSNHKVNIARPDPNHAEVTLDPADSVPNKDFVLRYQVAGGKIKSGVVARKDEKDPAAGTFSLMLVPPEALQDLPRQPLEMVFTVDVSGSQSGAPLAQEKAATRYCLTHMGPDDTFQVVRFGNTARTVFPNPVPATADNVRTALREVDSWDATEGTMLVDGIHASLLLPADPSRPRYVAFMTDGFIGNEAEALGEIHKCLGPSRIFSFGVGSSTNRYLLEHMAKMGNGAAAFLGLNDDANEVMAQYFDRISHPALTDVTIDWGGLQVSEVFPRRIPDLFVGRPVILAGRFTAPAGVAEGPLKIHVKGKAGRETREFDIPVNLNAARDNAAVADVKALPAVWARMKIADLADQATYAPNEALPAQIRQVALEHGLMSSFTAFVAVDSLTRTAGDHGTTVGVAVPVPDGVRYDTTVTETAATPAADHDNGAHSGPAHQ
jgi:Ca-activated chloride channel family protein